MYNGNAITFGRLHTWTLTFFYDKKRDFLRIKTSWPESGAWVELEPKVRIEVDPQTGEALAFEIEEFRLGFLARRPYLAPLWGQVQPTPIALRRMENTPFIASFLELMERLAYDPDPLKAA